LTDLQERIIAAAYPIITRNSFATVTIEEIEAAAGVSREDFEAEFASLDEVGVACLERRDREWTVGMVESGARERGVTPEGRLLAIFEVFDDWFQRDDFEACTFINVLVQMGREHPLGQASVGHLVHIRQLVATLADEAGLQEPEEFAKSWHILMKGSIISATEGDRDAALRAQAMARDLIGRHRAADVSPADVVGEEWLRDHDLAADAASGRAPVPGSLLDSFEWPDDDGPVRSSLPAGELILVATDTPSELLISVAPNGFSDDVHALERTETSGVFLYPCTPDFPRFGPFSSPDDALAAYRQGVEVREESAAA
jgi:AcrR family transcriptional regulator